MSKNILIVGDSWGLGEWGFRQSHVIGPQNEYTILHKGIEQYLKDDEFYIDNISEPGISLAHILFKLENHHRHNSYDHIVFFMGSLFRDHKKFSTFTNIDSLLTYHQQVVERTLEKLNNVGSDILLLGGLTKIPDNIKKYQNLKIVLNSIVEFLTPIEQKLFLIDVSNQINPNANDDLVNYVFECNKMWDSLQNYEDFIPDGMHPNRNGIYKYYQELKKYLI